MYLHYTHISNANINLERNTYCICTHWNSLLSYTAPAVIWQVIASRAAHLHRQLFFFFHSEDVNKTTALRIHTSSSSSENEYTDAVYKVYTNKAPKKYLLQILGNTHFIDLS